MSRIQEAEAIIESMKSSTYALAELRWLASRASREAEQVSDGKSEKVSSFSHPSPGGENEPGDGTPARVDTENAPPLTQDEVQKMLVEQGACPTCTV